MIERQQTIKPFNQTVFAWSDIDFNAVANWIGNGLNGMSDFMDAAIDDVTSTFLLMMGLGPKEGGGTVLVGGVPVTSGTAANPPVGGSGTGNKDLPSEITIWGTDNG